MTQATATLLNHEIPLRSTITDRRRQLQAPVEISPDRLARGIAAGRRLQGEAMRGVFRSLFDLAFTRRPQRGARLAGRHQPC